MKKLISIVLGICLGACSPSPKTEEGVTIDIEKSNLKDIPYSSFVDSISYIPLETNDDCLIGKIRDVILADSIIFVLKQEQDEILLFDRQGHYMRKIAKKGNGPGEYSIINQMDYNEKRKSIFILASNIIEYDLFGNVKHEYKLPFYASDLYSYDNGDFLISRFGRSGKPYTGVALVDSLGNIKENIFDKATLNESSATAYWELIPLKDGIHFISPQPQNTIYAFRDSLVATSVFTIEPKPVHNFEGKKPERTHSNKDYKRTVYRESDRWVNLIYSNKDHVRTILYDKKTGQYQVGETFSNDMDERTQIFFLSASTDNTFTNYVKAENPEDNPVIQILHLRN